MKLDPAPTEGQQLIVWVGLIHAFGTVEIVERTTDFDVGPNGKGRQQPTWLAVCVDPFYASYVGSLVVVRQFKTGTVFVLAVDNDNVLWGDPTPDDFVAVVREDEGADDDVGVSVTAGEAPVTRAFMAKVRSHKHGNTTIDVSAEGVIVNAAGEYGLYYVGMDFYHFIREFKKADKGMTYRKVKQ